MGWRVGATEERLGHEYAFDEKYFKEFRNCRFPGRVSNFSNPALIAVLLHLVGTARLHSASFCV